MVNPRDRAHSIHLMQPSQGYNQVSSEDNSPLLRQPNRAISNQYEINVQAYTDKNTTRVASTFKPKETSAPNTGSYRSSQRSGDKDKQPKLSVMNINSINLRRKSIHLNEKRKATKDYMQSNNTNQVTNEDTTSMENRTKEVTQMTER